jgi:spore germination protein YaaH
VADKEWVIKLVALAKQSIAAKKLVLGVANYGYEFAVSGTSPHYTYKKLRALNYQTFTALAASVGATPARDLAGELAFTYNKDGQTRLVSFSDSVAMADRVTIARQFGLKGVALFRVDGESDPNLWPSLR